MLCSSITSPSQLTFRTYLMSKLCTAYMTNNYR